MEKIVHSSGGQSRFSQDMFKASNIDKLLFN
jgi:hypothetical protein